MSETPKFKTGVGGSRGLASLLRQHNANPNGLIIGGTSPNSESTFKPFSSPTFKDVVEESSRRKSLRHVSPIPQSSVPLGKVLGSSSPAPPPPPRPPQPSSKPPETAYSTYETPVKPANTLSEKNSENSSISTPIPSTTTSKPVPPKPEPVPIAQESIKPLELPVQEVSSLSLNDKSNPPSPVPVIVEPPKFDKPKPPSRAAHSSAPISVAQNAIAATEKKAGSGLAIGAKAGELYTEGRYVGDGDEVDESEW